MFAPLKQASPASSSARATEIGRPPRTPGRSWTQPPHRRYSPADFGSGPFLRPRHGTCCFAALIEGTLQPLVSPVRDVARSGPLPRQPPYIVVGMLAGYRGRARRENRTFADSWEPKPPRTLRRRCGRPLRRLCSCARLRLIEHPLSFGRSTAPVGVFLRSACPWRQRCHRCQLRERRIAWRRTMARLPSAPTAAGAARNAGLRCRRR